MLRKLDLNILFILELQGTKSKARNRRHSQEYYLLQKSTGSAYVHKALIGNQKLMLINLTETRHTVKSFPLKIQFLTDFIVLCFLGCVIKFVITGSNEYIYLFSHASVIFFFFFLRFKKFLQENNTGFNFFSFFFCNVKLHVFAKKVKIESLQKDMQCNNNVTVH